MPEILKREKQLELGCRIMMIIDLLLILFGYFSYFQAKEQMVSPLIPKDTIAQILYETHYAMMKACLIAGIIFIPGLLLYSFRKRIPALILFVISAVCFAILR